jgi:hypothetical protein
MKTQPLWPVATEAKEPHPMRDALKQGREAGLAPASPIDEAADALWALFDNAYSHSGTRAEQASLPGCSKMVLTSYERRYEQVDSRDGRHGIAVSMMLSLVEGRVRGGALITTSRPYLSFFTAPMLKRGKMAWRVGTSGQMLTAEFVEDLFLCVLENNAEATRRLAPLITNSLG